MVVQSGARRVKSRSIPTVVQTRPQSQLYNSSGVPQGSPFGGGSSTVSSGTDQISYSTKLRAERWKTNYCEQRVVHSFYHGDVTSRQQIAYLVNPGWYYLYAEGHNYAASIHPVAVDTASSALNVSVGQGSYPGDPLADINTASPYLKPDLTVVSLPNFFLELGQVGELFQLWKQNISLARNLAGANLNYNFGWKPAIGDIKAMVSVITGLLDKLRAFEAEAGNIHHARYTLLSETITKSGTFNYLGNSQTPVRWNGLVHRTKVAGCSFQLQPFRVTKDYKFMLRAYLDALGFELNPRIIWDAIPFTFVLDWFFGIGSWLERHKTDTLQLPIVWTDSYVQYKEELTIQSSHMNDYGSSTVQTSSWPAWSTTRKYYRRIPIFPLETVWTGLGWKLPSLHQAELLVSLGTVLAKI